MIARVQPPRPQQKHRRRRRGWSSRVYRHRHHSIKSIARILCERVKRDTKREFAFFPPASIGSTFKRATTSSIQSTRSSAFHRGNFCGFFKGCIKDSCAYSNPSIVDPGWFGKLLALLLFSRRVFVPKALPPPSPKANICSSIDNTLSPKNWFHSPPPSKKAKGSLIHIREGKVPESPGPVASPWTVLGLVRLFVYMFVRPFSGSFWLAKFVCSSRLCGRSTLLSAWMMTLNKQIKSIDFLSLALARAFCQSNLHQKVCWKPSKTTKAKGSHRFLSVWMIVTVTITAAAAANNKNSTIFRSMCNSLVCFQVTTIFQKFWFRLVFLVCTL